VESGRHVDPSVDGRRFNAAFIVASNEAAVGCGQRAHGLSTTFSMNKEKNSPAWAPDGSACLTPQTKRGVSSARSVKRMLAYALLSAAVIYCQSSSDGSTATGGSSNTGDASTSGSGGGTGGSNPGNGDASASGGSAQGGSGGTTGNGGSTGTGGAGTGGSGGLTGAGGGTGTGGSTGGAGGPRDAAANDGRVADGRNDAAAGVGDASLDALAAYNPCPPAGQACRIMPLGDSITDGFITTPDERGGYRIELFRAAHSAGKTITFVGSQSNGPMIVDGVNFPMMHEGHTAYTIDDEPNFGRNGISEPGITDNGIANFRPHIVLLLIGTNDINLDVDQGMTANADARLGALMDKILIDDPTLLLVVGKITPTGVDATNTRVQVYNAGMNALVQARAAAGKHVMSVDMYAAFTADPNYKATLIIDGLHPTIAGYTRMGQVWYQAVSSLLH